MGWLWSPCCDILPPAFTGFVGIPLLNTPQRNPKCGFDLFILGTHMESIQYYFRMVQKLWKRVKHGKTMLKSQLSMVQPAFFRWSPPLCWTCQPRRGWPKASQDVMSKGLSRCGRVWKQVPPRLPWPSLTILDPSKKGVLPLWFLDLYQCLGGVLWVSWQT